MVLQFKRPSYAFVLLLPSYQALPKWGRRFLSEATGVVSGRGHLATFHSGENYLLMTRVLLVTVAPLCLEVALGVNSACVGLAASPGFGLWEKPRTCLGLLSGSFLLLVTTGHWQLHGGCVCR